ncbi:hypothetical protein ACFVGY_14435 [Streptomyces sp. NPDC127106]|uniref:hypothetical protein n=1 Tax=Streptomyces sp. NPDC127106 TaxID=3345360 RepID=UPI00363C6E6D
MVPLHSEMKVPTGVVLTELRSGGVLLDTARPVAAFVNPVALGWLRGQRPTAEEDLAYRRCVDKWRAAGLVSPDGSAPPIPDPVLAAIRARADRIAVPHPVLVVAMATECGFCAQLSADLAANTSVISGLDASVLLVNGAQGDVLGLPLTRRVREQLTGVGQLLSRLGTPSGALLTLDHPSRTVVGYPEVSAELVQLSGGDATATVVEAPTTCSLKVAGEGVDTLVAATADNGHTVGVAVRGADVLDAVRSATGEGLRGVYAPVTLTAERPGSLFLLYRGGELLARTRTSAALQHTLADVLTGYGTSGYGEMTLLCATALHRAGHAVLLPRNWMTDLVTHSTRLERAGWRICPRPYATLRPSNGQQPLLTGSPLGPRAGIPVSGILTHLPQAGGVLTRPQLLAEVVNWIRRPVRADAVSSLATAIGALPVHAGTWPEALSHLLAASHTV